MQGPRTPPEKIDPQALVAACGDVAALKLLTPIRSHVDQREAGLSNTAEIKRLLVDGSGGSDDVAAARYFALLTGGAKALNDFDGALLDRLRSSHPEAGLPRFDERHVFGPDGLPDAADAATLPVERPGNAWSGTDRRRAAPDPGGDLLTDIARDPALLRAIRYDAATNVFLVTLWGRRRDDGGERTVTVTQQDILAFLTDDGRRPFGSENGPDPDAPLWPALITLATLEANPEWDPRIPTAEELGLHQRERHDDVPLMPQSGVVRPLRR